MAKLLTEKERGGSGAPSQKWGKRLRFDPDSDYEDEPVRARMSRHAIPSKFGGGKSLSDVLGPLKGYLRKNCGRPWDDVYSELAKGLDKRSVSGLHVFTHLWQFVSPICWIGAETGTIYSVERFGEYGVPNAFYVHPFTGLLCKSEVIPSRKTSKRRKRGELNRPVEKIRLQGEGKTVELIKGIWYYMSNKLVTHHVIKIDKQGLPYDHSYQTWEFEAKIQLNKKELKKLKIKNGVLDMQG